MNSETIKKCDIFEVGGVEEWRGGCRPGPGIGLQLITPFGELTTLGRYQTSQHKVIKFGT